jgi:hypothetical protein
MTLNPTTQARENKYAIKSLTPLPEPLFSGLKLQQDIQLGSLILNRLATNNVIWICTDIDGWWGQPDVEFDDVPKSGTDGSYNVDGRYQSRSLELSGVILPPDPSFVSAARAALISATDLVRTGAWLKTTTSTGVTTAAYVRLVGRPVIETVNARGRTEFSIPLRAVDPVKYLWNSSESDGFYAATVQASNSGVAGSGSVVINNTGDYSVGAIFTVTGPLTGTGTVANTTTNKTMPIIGGMASATILRIDTYNRTVSYNGSFTGARARLEPLATWLTLRPGNNTITFVDAGTATGTAQLVIKYRPGWIG